MKNLQFKLTQGELAAALADKYDILATADSTEPPEAAASEEPVRQSAYVTPSGISYRISALASCFATSHTVNKLEFFKRPTLVMLNGLTRTKDHWVDFDKLLAQGVNVITVDTRGMGESRLGATWNLTIDQMSDDVKAVLDDLQLEAAFILGFSLGGMVALMFALRYPRRTRALIVINTSMGGGARSFRLYPQSVAGLARAIISGGGSFHHTLSQYVLSGKTGDEMRAGAARLWADLEKRYGKNVLMTIKQLLAASRFRDPKKLMAIQRPTLVIFGEKDHFVPSSHSAYIFAYLKMTILKGIPEGGHELHFDKPHELKATILDFLGKYIE